MKGKDVKVKLMKQEIEGIVQYKMHIDNEPICSTWINISERDFESLLIVLDQQAHRPKSKSEAIAKQSIYC